MNEANQVILFDGTCNLCNASVRFIIKRDPSAKFLFSTLQSDFGKQLLKNVGIEDVKYDSVILYKNGKVYKQSDAVLLIARQLSGLWSVFFVLIIIPRPIRNVVYNWIARNRYHWFGKRDVCMSPSPEIKHRFLN